MIQVNNIQLSVIITVYSERTALEQTIERLFKNDQGEIIEVLLIVAPFSSQACWAVCEQLSRQYPWVVVHRQERNPGVGWAVRQGMALARGNYLAIMSADLETEPEAVARMVAEIRKTGCDLVIADRWLPASRFENYNRLKLVLNWLFQQIFARIFKTSLRDLTYGFKVLHQRAARQITWQSTRHEIFIETTIKPLQAGFSVSRVPTLWRGRQEGRSHNNFFYNLRYVRLALSVALQGRQGKS